MKIYCRILKKRGRLSKHFGYCSETKLEGSGAWQPLIRRLISIIQAKDDYRLDQDMHWRCEQWLDSGYAFKVELKESVSALAMELKEQSKK